MAEPPSAADLQNLIDGNGGGSPSSPGVDIYSRGANVSWGYSRLSPASYLYVYRESKLLWNVWNAISGAQYTLGGLIIGTDGELHELQFLVSPAADRSQVQNIYPLDEGFLLGLVVRVSNGTVTRGAAYSTVTLARGSSTTQLPLIPLIADNVSNSNFIGWPGSPVRQSIEGPGTIRYISGTQPAAGAEVQELVPTGARWRLITTRLTLVTSSTAGDRKIAWSVTDPALTARLQASTAQIYQRASLSVEYYAQDTPSEHTWGVDRLAIAFPPIVLLAGFRLRTKSLGLKSDDQWSAPQMLVEEWIEP